MAGTGQRHVEEAQVLGVSLGLLALWAQQRPRVARRLFRRGRLKPDAATAIDPYAAENPAEFFAVTSEYFFSAPDLLHQAYPGVYEQLKAFYRQDPLARLRQLQAEDPVYQASYQGL